MALNASILWQRFPTFLTYGPYSDTLWTPYFKGKTNYLEKNQLKQLFLRKDNYVFSKKLKQSQIYTAVCKK